MPIFGSRPDRAFREFEEHIEELVRVVLPLPGGVRLALTTKGEFRACPFAAEIDSPHYDLGRIGTEPNRVFENYRRFRKWADDTLDPAATARGISSCEMCHKNIAELPVPEYA